MSRLYFLMACLTAILLVSSMGCMQSSLKVCGGVQGISCPEGYVCKVEDESVTDAFGECMPVATTQTSTPKLCEIGKVYEESASKKVDCACPEGYAFGYSIIGYHHDGDVESPIMGVQCVKVGE